MSFKDRLETVKSEKEHFEGEAKEMSNAQSLSQSSVLDVLKLALPRFLTYDEIAAKFPNENCMAVYKICKRLRTHRNVDEVRLNGQLCVGYDLQGREHKVGSPAKCKEFRKEKS